MIFLSIFLMIIQKIIMIGKIETFGLDFDTDLECKEKDIALFKYRKDYGVL